MFSIFAMILVLASPIESRYARASLTSSPRRVKERATKSARLGRAKVRRDFLSYGGG